MQEAILRMWHHQADKGNTPPDLPLVFSTIRFCGLNHHRSESRRRKREESVIYLNDFQDVWLDPVLEEDEEAVILQGRRPEPQPETARGGGDEILGRTDIFADFGNPRDFAEHGRFALPLRTWNNWRTNCAA